MENIFKKDIWNDEDWTIYINNINILREYYNLSKNDFNEKIGIRNAFRRDPNKPGRKTILSIWKEFGVDEKWLGYPQKKIPEIKEEGGVWDRHGGFKRRILGKDWEMAGKALSILSSKTPYSEILATSINTLYEALQKEESLEKKTGSGEYIIMFEGILIITEDT